MKTILHSLMMAALLLSTMQLTKGQSEDARSSKVIFVESTMVGSDSLKLTARQLISGMMGVECDTVLMKQLLQVMNDTVLLQRTLDTMKVTRVNNPAPYLNLPSTFNWYVSPSGSDSNAGTQQAPFKTIQKAIDKASAGQAIKIADGKYAGFFCSKNVYLVGNLECPQTVVLEDQSASYLVSVYGCSPELHGMTISRSSYGINLWSGYPKFSHLIITEITNSAFYVTGDNAGFGLFNSLIYGNGSSSTSIVNLQPSSSGLFDVCNNTIVDNTANYTINVAGSGVNLYLTNNIIYNGVTSELTRNSSPGYVFIEYSDIHNASYLSSIATMGSGVVDGNPYFVDSSIHDYRIGYLGSPCVDKGHPNYFDRTLPPGVGTTRSDMGAYGWEARMSNPFCTIPAGNDMNDPIIIGSYNSDFSKSIEVNTTYYTNSYGMSWNDVFIKFSIGQTMNMTISHCGSTVTDTYVYLLDSSGDRMGENNNNSGYYSCANNNLAYLRKALLPAGTYYVVSEGVGQNGAITVSIEGKLPLASAEFDYPDAPVGGSTETGTVGEVGGSLDVSPTGAAIYTIPIDAPPGVGGMQPQIAITYNSQAGNGVAGWGCNIAGISAITRAPKTIYHDTNASGVTHRLVDAFMLDGQRLIHDNSINNIAEGNIGAVYHPENDPMTKVTIEGEYKTNMSVNGTYYIVYDDRWFKVEREGMTFYYGKTHTSVVDSRQSYIKSIGNDKYNLINAWNIGYAENVHGNYIAYYYGTNGDTGARYPYSITYGASSVQNTISFEYDNTSRQDPITYVMDGVTVNMTRRLSGITTKTGNKVYRTYTLAYNTTGDGTNTKFSRLYKITVKNGASEELKPITLSWNYLPGTSTINYTTPTVPAASVTPSIPHSDQTFISMDINNDGLDDLIGIFSDNNSSSPVIQVFKYTASLNNNNLNFSSGSMLCQLTGQYVFDVFKSIMGGSIIGDFNGDGKKDLLISFFKQIGNDGEARFNFIDENGLGVSSSHEISAKVFGITPPVPPLVAMADFNNDGSDDVITLEKEPVNALIIPPHTYMCRILFKNHAWLNMPISLTSKPDKFFTGDFDGDGLIDIMFLDDTKYVIYWNQGNTNGAANPFSENHKTTGSSITNVRMIRMGDFNGDGLPDFIMNAKDDKNWNFALNNGDGTFSVNTAYSFTTQEIPTPPATAKNDHQFNCQVFDFDMDGKSDVVITMALFTPSPISSFVSTYTFWMRSTGTTLTKKASATSNKENDAENRFLVLGDFNGDGQMEPIHFGFNNIFDSSTSLTQKWRLFRNPNYDVKSGKITGIQNVAGTTTIDYKTMTDPTVYTKGSGGIGGAHPVIDVTLPVHAVRQVTVPNGVAGNTVVEYKYEGMKIHTQGLGFLGMKKMTVDNTTTGVKTETGISSWYTQVTYLIALGKTYTKTIITENNVAKTEMVKTEMKHIGTDNSKIWFHLPEKMTKTYMDGDSATTIYKYYEGFQTSEKGYLKSDSTIYWPSMYRVTHYRDYTPSASGYKPQLVIAIQKYENETPFTQKTKFEYSAKGLPTKKIENYGSSMPLTTDYVYDSFGNLTDVKVSGNGVKPVTSHTIYDATKRFPTRQYTIPASTKAAFGYDDWGNLKTERDVTNPSDTAVLTQHDYDNWGRRTLTTLPDGRKIGYSSGWGNTTAKRYYVLTQATGAPWTKTWYDAAGRETETETRGADNMVIATKNTYNSKGQMTAQETLYGETSTKETYTYDARGRLATSKSTASGQTTTYGYGVESGKKYQTTSVNGQLYKKTFDAWGNIISSSTSSTSPTLTTSVTYTYHSSGQPKTIITGGATFQMTYDDTGRQKTLNDPNAGITTYTYDALGRLTQQVENGNTTTMHYYRTGRDSCRVQGGVTTYYKYGSKGYDKERLKKIQTGSDSIVYTYNKYGQPRTEKRYMAGVTGSLNFSYQYTKSQLDSVTYPGGLKVSNFYDGYGNLVKVQAGAQTVWELAGKTATLTTTKLGGGSMTATQTYNAKGQLTNLKTVKGATVIRDMDYSFKAATGNLTSRKGMFYNGSTAQTETFGYDSLYRLKTIHIGATPPGTLNMTINYKTNGNIQDKTGLGTYDYHATKVHAVEYIDNTGGLLNTRKQTIDYNAFNKATVLIDTVGNVPYRLDITYGPDQKRWKTVLKKNNNITPVKTVLFAGNYERVIRNDTTTHLYYIKGGIYVKQTKGTTTQTTLKDGMYYVHPDHLGSLVVITDATGAVKQKCTFDAWGKREFITKDNTLIFDRGYTGHEHLPEFSLINMNGRMYDPIVGRFLSPDNYVQAPDFSQSFNRYSYCLNNPLIYTDPDGEFWWLIAAAAYTLFFTDFGYDVQKYISPVAVKFEVHPFGTHERYFGVKTSIGVPQVSPVSYRWEWGANYYTKFYDTGWKGWETTYGEEFGLLGLYTAGFTDYKTHGFPGGDFDQTVLRLKVGVPGLSGSYYNDYINPEKSILNFCRKITPDRIIHKGDAAEDRWRTAAAHVQVGPFSWGMKVITGDPGPKKDRETYEDENGQKYYKSWGKYDPIKYSNGIVYYGFGPFRFGSDSEGNRNKWQNENAHRDLGIPFFPTKDRRKRFYFFW